MANVNASITVTVKSSAANAELAAMQSRMAALNKTLSSSAANVAKGQMATAAMVGDSLNRSGKWTATMGNMMTATGRLAQQFDKGTMSWQQWQNTSKKATKTFGDQSAMHQLAAARVRALQTQYVALGKEVDGTQKVMKMQPTGMLRDWGAEAMFAQQKAVLFRRRLEMGANSMVNWGKNTQWAGRQMMVGMGIPMAIAAAGAVKSFKEIETASIAFKRVYGDATTSAGEKSQMLGTIQKGVAQDMTKYGIAVADTIDIAAKVAATGQQGDNLVAATTETMRLATLGQMDYQTALESTIATQTAFGVKASDMSRVTDFMNAAENQTILSMSDMAKAIPRVAPVIKGLGGDVEDLGVLMTALRAGGVTAEQGANALKSGLASLINPTDTAVASLNKMGVPIDKIVKANRGELIPTVQAVGKALDGLSNFKRQQALETLFGKYQYARMGALFKNINKGQAKEAAKLSGASDAQLAKMSETELGQIADSALTKFQGAVERLKAAAAPLGEAILSSLTPVIDGFSKVVGFLADNEGARNVLLIGAAFAGLAGVVTMVTGVLANFFGTMTKGALLARRGFDRMMGRPLPAYQSIADLEASAAQRQLSSAASAASGSLYAEASAAGVLSRELMQLESASMAAASGQRALAGGRTGAIAGRAAAGTGTQMGATPIVSQASSIATAHRAHISRPIDLRAPEHAETLAAIKSKYADNKLGAAIASAEASGKSISGYNARFLAMAGDLNDEMDRSGSQGVSAQKLLADAQAKQGGILKPFFEHLSRGAGISPGQLVAMPEVRAATENFYRDYTRAMAEQGSSMITGGRFDDIVEPMMQKHFGQFPAGSPLAKGWEATGQVHTVKTGEQKFGVSGLGATANWKNIPLADAEKHFDLSKYKFDDVGAAVLGAQRGVVDSADQLTASQTRGAQVIGQTADAVESKVKKPLTSKTGLIGNIGQMGKIFTPPQSWTSARKGGAFSVDANGLSNKMFGLGMAADMVTMGLAMSGKEMPIWSHMLGMGISTLAMFPEQLVKPFGAIKQQAISAGNSLKAIGTSGKGLVTNGFNKIATKIPGTLLGLGMLGGQSLMSGIGSLMSVLPGALLGAAAIGGTIYLANNAMNNAIQQGAKTIAAQATATGAVTAFAQEAGKESVSMKMHREAIEYATDSNITQAEMAETNARLQGQAGQAMIKQVTVAKEGGIATGINSIVSQAAGLYGEGLVGRKGAIKIGVALAEATGMESQVVDVIAKIKEVTGEGIDSPIEVQAKLAEQNLSPQALLGPAVKASTEAPWYAQAWADISSGADMDAPLTTGGAAGFAGAGLLGAFILNNAVSGEDVLSARSAGMGAAQYGVTPGTVTSASEILAGLNSMFAYSRDMQDQASAEFTRAIEASFSGAFLDNATRATAETLRGLGQQGADMRAAGDEAGGGALQRGVWQIEAMYSKGDISPDALNALMSGDSIDDKNVALKFDSADSVTSKMMGFIAGEQKGNAGNLISAMQDPNVGIDQLSRQVKAYEKLGIGGRGLNIDFGAGTTADEISGLKGIANQIEGLPTNVQTQFNLRVEGKEDIENTKLMLNDLEKYSAKQIKIAMDTKGLRDGVDDVKELQRLLDILNGEKDYKIPTRQKPPPKVEPPDKPIRTKDIKLPKASQKVDRTVGKDETKKKAKNLNQKINRTVGKDETKKKPKTLTQKVNRAVGKDGSIKKPKLLKQLVNRAIGKDGSIKRPKLLQQLIDRLLGNDPSKDPPGSLKQLINRLLGSDQSKQNPGDLKQIINRALGARDDKIPADTLSQIINRVLGARPELTPPGAVIQTVNRVVRGAMATGGPVDSFDDTQARSSINGRVTGPGGPTSDKVAAWLSNGEFVIKTSAVNKYGTAMLGAINSGAYADGGPVYLAKGGNGKKDKEDKGNKRAKERREATQDWKSETKDMAILFGKSFKLINKKKLFGSLLAGILGSDSRKIYGQFGDKKMTGKDKALAKRIKKADKLEQVKAFADDQASQAWAAKARKERVKLSKTLDIELTNLFSDEELTMWRKMSKKQRNRIIKQRQSELADQKKLETKEAMKEVKDQVALAKYRNTAYAGANKGDKDAIQNMSDEELQLYKDGNTAILGLVKQRLKAEEAAANRERQLALDDENKYAGRFGDPRITNSGLSSDALAGLSQEDFETMLSLTGAALAAFIRSLNDAAAVSRRVGIIQENLALTQGEQYQKASSALDELSQSYRDQAQVQADQALLKKTGKTRGQIEAQNQMWQTQVSAKQHQQELLQRNMDDINKAYERQRKVLDQIEAAQQAISNLEKGRISVASALSSGDIAAAAAAAQEQRAAEASFNREQMRTALQNEQDELIENRQDMVDAIQDSIDAISDRIFANQQLLDESNARAAVLGENMAAKYEKYNLQLKTSKAYWNAIRRNIFESVEGLDKIKAVIAWLSKQPGGGVLTRPRPGTPPRPTGGGGGGGGGGRRPTPTDAGTGDEAADVAERAAARAAKRAKKLKRISKKTGEDEKRARKAKKAARAAREAADDARDAATHKDAAAAREAKDRAVKAGGKVERKLKKGMQSLKQDQSNWQRFKNIYGKLGNADQKFLQNQVFNGKWNEGAWRSKFFKFSPKDQKALLASMNKQDLNNAEKKDLKRRFSHGGWVTGQGYGDSVSALLTPGEFVVNKYASARFGKSLERINSPSYRLAGKPGMAGVGMVNSNNNTYNVTVNATTNANADEIADITIRKIKTLESSNVRRRNYG